MSREENAPYDEGMGSSELRNTKERLQDAGSKIKERASQIAGATVNAASRQRGNAADLLDRAASGLHTGVDSAGQISNSVESGMRSTAGYIRDHDFKEMGNDLMGVCRKHPAQALISAAVVGFLLGRAARGRA